MDLTSANVHRTAARVIDMLEMVAASISGVRLNQLTAGTDTPKSLAREIADELVATGYLDIDHGLYTLGPSVGNLLSPQSWHLTLPVRAVLETLRDETDETVLLTTSVGLFVVNLQLVESRQSKRFSAPLGQRRPIYPTSAGKVFLAHWSARRRAAFLGSTIADPGERRRVALELSEVRRERIAYNRAESSSDFAAVAAPVMRNGEVAAAVVTAGPTMRITPRYPALTERVKQAAGQLAGLGAS